MKIGNKACLFMFLCAFVMLVALGFLEYQKTESTEGNNVIMQNENGHDSESIIVGENQTLIRVSSCWRSFTLEEAVACAEVVVRGKVSEKSDTKSQDRKDTTGKVRGQDYYKEVTIEVLEAIKGCEEGGTVTYVERGGETERVLCIYDGLTPLNVGDEYILFLNEKGYCLNPWTMLKIENETVIPSSDMMSEELKESQTYNSLPHISVNDYIAVIKELLHK